MSRYIVLTSLFLTLSAFGKLKLNVNITHKKHIDNKLVLKNELHEALEILEGQPSELKSRNDLRFVFTLKTFQNTKSKKLILIETSVYDDSKSSEVSRLLIMSTLGEKIQLVTKDAEGSVVDFQLSVLED